MEIILKSMKPHETARNHSKIKPFIEEKVMNLEGFFEFQVIFKLYQRQKLLV